MGPANSSEAHVRPLSGFLAASAALVFTMSAVPAFAADAAEKPLKQHGTASYYSDRLSHNKAADGSIYHRDDLTAASMTLPLGTKAKVVNKANGRSVMVRVTDRGPHKRGRIIDGSKKAADQLGMKHAGVVPVEVQVQPSEQPTPALRRQVAEKAARQHEK